MANAFNQALTGAGDVMTGLRTGLTWFLFASPLLIGVFFVVIMKKYKHKIILRQKTKGDTDIVIESRFTILKKKGEPEQIRTMKRRLKLPLPPDDAIDIQQNGAYFVEGYITEGGEVTYIKADAKRHTETIKHKHEVPLKKGGKHVIETTEDKHSIKDIKLTKLTTEDKSFYFNRERLANQKYQVNDIWSFLNQNAGVIGLIIFCFLIFLFWTDIMQPAIEMQEKTMGISDNLAKVTANLDKIINDRQQIGSGQTFNTTKPPD